MDEAKIVANNNNEESINPKKPPVPDFPGQSDGSGGWIEFETPISKDNDSKGCQ